MKPADFEPVVEFPDDPFDAARMYLAVLAFPERGAGMEGGNGAKFSEALFELAARRFKEQRGAKALQAALGEQHPALRDMRPLRRKFDQGCRRIWQRLWTLQLYRQRTTTGLMEVAPNTSPFTLHDLQSATPPAGAILRRDLPAWSARLALNMTGLRGDTPSARIHDLKRRAANPSRPVLHVAHGLEWSLASARNIIPIRHDAHPLLAALFNPEPWIWIAIELAEEWRLAARLPGRRAELRAEHMVELRRKSVK